MQKDFEPYADEINRGLTSDSVDEASTWDKPLPFPTVDTPPFPADSLPSYVRDFVTSLAESTQTPLEMAGILSLGVLSTAFQHKYVIQITPDWAEPLCLFIVAVASPAERKSAVINALTEPIYNFEVKKQKENASEIARNQEEREVLEKEKKAAEAEVIKGGANADAMRGRALDLAAKLDAFEDLRPLRLLVDDVTPEKLIDIMDGQDGSITVCSTEGGVFGAMRGRYSSQPSLDVYLKGHAGDPVSVDRIGRGANHISAPRLTMILTIQPVVLQGLMDDASFRGRGLCGRFLYSICRSKIGNRISSPKAISPDVKAAYRDFVFSSLSNDGEGIVTLSADANKRRVEYQDQVENKLGCEWCQLQDWGGKLVGATLRIAALLHLSSYSANEPISAETMEDAIKIADFLGPHAEAAYQMMGSNGIIGEAEALWRRIKAQKTTEISRRDLYRSLRGGKYKQVEDLDALLEILVEYGYIRIIYDGKETAGRKSSPTIKINPLAM